MKQPFAGPDGLLEREAELEAVEELIGAVGDGGRLLAIEGPPGIGKTALLAAAKGLGQAAGLRVLGARALAASLFDPAQVAIDPAGDASLATLPVKLALYKRRALAKGRRRLPRRNRFAPDRDS